MPVRLGKSAHLVPIEFIERRIYLMRGHKVMLDLDLAFLYGVETRALLQAVKRNRDRFPADFMFQFSQAELERWRSQIVMSNPSLKWAFGAHRPLSRSRVSRCFQACSRAGARFR